MTLYFIEDARGNRAPVDAELVKTCIKQGIVDVLVNQRALVVVRRKNARPQHERLRYGGGNRLRQPFDYLA